MLTEKQIKISMDGTKEDALTISSLKDSGEL
jgi:hypothetical protein